MATRLAALSALALLAACSTGPQGAEVTRFHLGQPIARSTVALVPAEGGQGGLEFGSYADAVARELTAQSFIAVPAGDTTAAYIGTITVTQTARPGRSGGGFSIGIGGGVGGGGYGRHGGSFGGVGGGVTVPISGGHPNDIRATTLGLQLKRRSDATVVWEGRATSEAQGAAGDLDRAVPELAHALLAGFPGARGQTVRVKAR
ncbi:DUF4136 domain-containing protein [Sphingosinicellaceae bacterium]|nr:DUF4136 domain-containing protein [Sphingosinicellaceae bacterium]